LKPVCIKQSKARYFAVSLTTNSLPNAYYLALVLHSDIIVVIIIIVAVWLTIKARKLTLAGAITGGLLALSLYLGIGLFGLVLLGAFFLTGTVATAWQAGTKARMGMAQEEKGRRTLGQVLANGGIAGLIGILAMIFTEYVYTLALMIAGSLSAATADTLSSELGTVYGRRFYNCITFKKDQRGLDGVISIEGLGIGVVGSALIAVFYCLGFGWSIAWLIIVLSGTIGNLADSVLGATLEQKGKLSNNMVNFLNTLVGALAAIGLYAAFDLY